MPAVWSPLKGGGTRAQPLAAPSATELNQIPKWKVWTGANIGLVLASRGPCGVGATAEPTATAKVSSFRRLTKVWVCPFAMSPRYQAMPKGLLGTWMTNTSNLEAV